MRFVWAGRNKCAFYLMFTDILAREVSLDVSTCGSISNMSAALFFFGFDTDKRDLELLACSWEETSAVSIRLSAVATNTFLLFSLL